MQKNPELYSCLDRPIPRISVHAFRTAPEFVRAIDGAAADRRFYKVSVTVSDGDFEEAINYYSERSTPDLLIIESNEDAGNLQALLHRLAAVSEKHTKLVLAAPINDVALYRELNRYGVADYLNLPVSDLQVIDVVAGLFGSHQPRGKMVAFISAKGGAGSSILSHNTACHLSTACEADVLLADYDLYFGTAGINFNVTGDKNLGDLLVSRIKIDDTVLENVCERYSERLRLVTAPCQLTGDFRFTAAACEAIADSARRIASFAVFDLPYGFLQNNRETLMQADTVVLVTTPEVAGVRNVADIYGVLREARPNDPEPLLVLNQFGVPSRQEVTLKQFEEVLGFRPDFVVPYEPELFGKAGSKTRLPSQLGLKNPSPGLRALQRLAETISGKRVPQQDLEELLEPIKKSQSLLGRLGISRAR